MNRFLVLLLLLDTSPRDSAFDPSRANVTAVIKGGDEFIMNVAVSPGGGFMAAPRRDGKIALWSGERALKPLDGHTGYAYAAAFAADGRLATGGIDTLVKVWTLADRTSVVLRGHTGTVHALSWSRDSEWLASAGDDGLRIWRKNREAGFARSPLLLCAAFNPDGASIATGGADGMVRVWSTDGKPLRVLKGHAGPVLSVAWSPGGRLASGGIDKTVRLWGADGKCRELAQRGVVRHIAFDAAGRTLVAAGSAGVHVIEVADGKSHAISVRAGSSAVFSGRSIVSVHNDNRIRVTGSGPKVDPDEGERLSGFLGVSYEDAAGAKVSSVVDDSQAQALGFAADDLIVGIEEIPVGKSDDFLNFMRATFEGDEVLLRVKRGGEDRVFRAKLGRWK